MMRAALVFLALAACTRHRNIVEAHEVAGEEVVLEGQYGQEVTAVGVRDASGITFYDKANGGMVPDHEIKKIKETSHGRGALQGLGIGAGIGVGLGVIAGMASGDDECDSDRHSDCSLAFSAGAKAVIFSVLLGGTGGLIGLIVGAMKGSTTIYEAKGSDVSVRIGGPGLTMTF